MFTVKELGPELGSMYKEYLRLTSLLDSGGISASEALRTVSLLQVTDLYGNVWTIDPETGGFRLTDARGVVRRNAQPADFRSSKGYTRGDSLGDIPDFDYGDGAEVVPPTTKTRTAGRRGRTFAWLGGVVAAALAAGAGGYMVGAGSAPEAPATPSVVVERPALPSGAGPAADRVGVVLGALSSGNPDSIRTSVADVSDSELLQWVISALPSFVSSQHRIIQVVEPGGFPVLHVVDSANHVVMAADLKWVQDQAGVWKLATLPVFRLPSADARVDGGLGDVEHAYGESPAPSVDPSTSSEAPADGTSTEGSTGGTGPGAPADGTGTEDSTGGTGPDAPAAE